MADATVSRRWSWEQAVCRSDLQSTTRHVLLTLATYAGRQGASIFPSVKTLCRDTGLSKRTVQKHLKLAEEAGWISRVTRQSDSGRQQSNQYVLAGPEGEGASGAPPPGEGASAAGGRGQLLRGEGAPSDTPTTLNRPENRPGEGDAPAKKSRKKKRRTSVPESFHPTADHLQYAEANRLDVEDQRERFILYHQREGTLAASWNAAFSMWLRNAVRFRERDAKQKDPEPAGQGGFWR